ncbi:MAG: UPF0175 family protein [Lewinellaceae bacterium]|nr:UPF0175 family protein [Saprospiraceae bacterium]MCB9331941.1 UPF0175 family protein [Lewinellaceae bacterium]
MVLIEDSILEAANMSEQELKIELAILLYRKNRLTYAQARKLSELSRIEFDDKLAEAGIPSDYTVEDLHADLKTLEELRPKYGDRK